MSVALPCYEFYTIIWYISVHIIGGTMSKNTSITLGQHFDGFISKQIKDGRYASASEVVRAGLRLLEDNEHKIAVLRKMLEEGEQSGTVEYNFESFMNELDDELG
ncbi:CC2985 family antitoxin [Oleiphilus messinensis]|uniref:Antitoxin ParD n=2 Tax=Oleiphilus messinensis TaxID=141451 RepID=A0A1Y0ICX5_9GAMM|nr:CC2985 family antitoxin [Oleiphilus messinensis]